MPNTQVEVIRNKIQKAIELNSQILQTVNSLLGQGKTLYEVSKECKRIHGFSNFVSWEQM